MSEASRVNLYLRAENRLVFGETKNKPLPVTIVTGFLGAGKTTLLRHILSNKHNLRIAAAVNDFASLNIDGDLLANVRKGTTGKAAEEVVELSNGCVCCSLSDDLKSAVWKMLDEDVNVGRIQYLVIETSGVTDPASIIRTLEASFGKMYRARLDSVVTVLDSEQWHAWISQDPPKIPSGVAESQLMCADVILLNKTDLLQEKQLTKLEAFVTKAAPGVTLHRTCYSKIALPKVLDVAPEVGTGPESQAAFVSHEETEQAFLVCDGVSLEHNSQLKRKQPNTEGQNTESKGVGAHLKQDSYSSVSFESRKPMSLAGLQDFCMLGIPPGTVRMKGVLWVREHGKSRCVVQMSGRRRLHFQIDGEWTGPPNNQIVLIGSGFNEKEVVSYLARACEHPYTPPPPPPPPYLAKTEPPPPPEARKLGSERLSEARELVSSSLDFDLVRTKIPTATHRTPPEAPPRPSLLSPPPPPPSVSSPYTQSVPTSHEHAHTCTPECSADGRQTPGGEGATRKTVKVEAKERAGGTKRVGHAIETKEAGGLVAMRLSGSGRFKMSAREVKFEAGIDLDSLNVFLVDAVNSAGKVLATYNEDAEGNTVVYAAVGGAYGFKETLWASLSRHADVLLKEVATRIKSCKCD